MLVLTRTTGQKIVLRAGLIEIVVTITRIRGDKVRVGISAPGDVAIAREELQRKVDAEGWRDE